MSISGDLQDVSVAEVMQFIHLGRRTGTLYLRYQAQEASIGFHRGRIIGAARQGSLRLGELLLQRDLVTEDQLLRALETQRSARPRPSLGKVLVDQGLISTDNLRVVVGSQIEHTVYQLVTWRAGSFDFTIDELQPMDDIGVYPGDILPDINLDTQMVVLDALRIFDEKNRLKEAEREAGIVPDAVAPESEGPSQSPAAGRERMAGADDYPETATRLQIVSSDRALVEDLSEIFAAGEIGAVEVELRDAGLALPGQSPPVVLVDLRGETGIKELIALTRARTRAAFVAIPAEPEDTSGIYTAGAIAALPADAALIANCVTNFFRLRGREQGPSAAASSAAFAKLRRVIADLRSGLLSATVALNLMQVISESVERAVMFLVREKHLLALGAFGYGSDGSPLAGTVSGLKMDLVEPNALTESVDHGKARSMMFEEAGLPERLERLLGRPRTGQTVIFPVLGSESVISVVYTDNGQISREIGEIEILELAAAQVGVAFENELLRREMARKED